MSMTKSTLTLVAATALCTSGWALADDGPATTNVGSSMTTSGLDAKPMSPGEIAGQPCGDTTLTQSTDPKTIVPGTVQCAVAGLHTAENGLARSFALDSDTSVCGVQFGIETNTGGAWDATINLYAGDINGPFGGLDLRGSSTVTIPDGAEGEFFVALFDPPVEFSSGENLVVEIFNPTRDPALGGDGGALWPGSNNLGESDPGYIRADTCGIADFATYASIGFPDVHLAIEVYAGGGGGCVGDLDGSGEVDGADLALLLGAWGPCDDPDDCPGDLDGSGEVDGADLALLLGAWGECPGPPPLECLCDDLFVLLEDGCPPTMADGNAIPGFPKEPDLVFASKESKIIWQMENTEVVEIGPDDTIQTIITQIQDAASKDGAVNVLLHGHGGPGRFSFDGGHTVIPFSNEPGSDGLANKQKFLNELDNTHLKSLTFFSCATGGGNAGQAFLEKVVEGTGALARAYTDTLGARTDNDATGLGTEGARQKGQEIIVQPPAANDKCADAIDITGNIDGDPVTGDNTQASPGPGDPDAPAGSPICHWSGAPEAIHNTLWYKFTAPEGGIVDITSCGSTGTLIDSIIAVYDGTCGSFVEVGCGEDECGAPTYFSTLTADGLTPGEEYYVLFANTGDWAGSAEGTFSFVITAPTPPSNCCEASPGTKGCDDQACEDAVCAELAFCCSFEWDDECATLANEICDVCEGGGEPGVCGPGAGDCCTANGTPGCEDVACCEAICAADPFCCDTSWDSICAGAADTECAVCN